MRGVERDRKKVNKEITQCREKKKQTTDISTSILSILQVVFSAFCSVPGALASVLMFGKCKQFRYYHKSILPFLSFICCCILWFSFEIALFSPCSKSKATVFSVFPVFFIWFEDSLVLFLSVCSLVPSLFNKITCVKKPNKCDYVAVCRDMW